MIIIRMHYSYDALHKYSLRIAPTAVEKVEQTFPFLLTLITYWIVS